MVNSSIFRFANKLIDDNPKLNSNVDKIQEKIGKPISKIPKVSIKHENLASQEAAYNLSEFIFFS